MPDFGPPVHFLATLDAKLSERETPTSPVTSQVFTRTMLLGVRVRINNGLWERICEERWLTPRAAAELRAKQKVTHTTLETGMAALERIEIVKYGAPLGVAIESDEDGKDVRGTTGIPDLRIPVPIRALYTPSLVPAWNGTTPAAGKILTGEGIASFTCPFMAAEGDAPDTAIVTLGSPSAPCIAAGFTYRLKLSGDFKLALTPGTRLPQTFTGNYAAMVDGGLTDESPVRLLDHKVSFEMNRVEIKETDDGIQLV